MISMYRPQSLHYLEVWFEVEFVVGDGHGAFHGSRNGVGAEVSQIRVDGFDGFPSQKRHVFRMVFLAAASGSWPSSAATGGILRSVTRRSELRVGTLRGRGVQRVWRGRREGGRRFGGTASARGAVERHGTVLGGPPTTSAVGMIHIWNVSPNNNLNLPWSVFDAHKK